MPFIAPEDFLHMADESDNQRENSDDVDANRALKETSMVPNEFDTNWMSWPPVYVDIDKFEIFEIETVASVSLSPKMMSNEFDCCFSQDIDTEMFRNKNAGILQLKAESAIQSVNSKLDVVKTFNRVLILRASRPKPEPTA